METTTERNTNGLRPTAESQPTEASPDRADPRTPGSRGKRTKAIRIGTVLGVALAAGAAVWLFAMEGENRPSAATTAQTTTAANVVGAPRATSLAALRKLAAAGTAVYWAGPEEQGQTLTLVTGSDGSSYVRYLPPGVKVTDPVPPSLVVATYPLKDGLAAVERAAREPDAVSIALENGGMAVYSKSRLTNVYFAYPDADVQVEVYDPAAGGALELVRSGSITPVTP
jgi:hypothetical protein